MLEEQCSKRLIGVCKMLQWAISNFKVVKTQNDPSGGEGGNTSGSQGGSDEPDTKPDGGTISTRPDSTNNLLKNTTFDNF